MTSHIELVKENFTLRSDLASEIREVASAATTEKRTLTEDEQSKVDDLRSQLDAADARIQANLEMEERGQEIAGGIESMLGALVDRDRGDVVDTRSIGERFVQDEGFQPYVERGRGAFAVDFPGVDLRALTSVDANDLPLGGSARVDRVGQNVLSRRVFLSDVLPVISVGKGSVEYVQDSTASYDAAEQTEGSAKQARDMTGVVVNEPVATVAAYTELTRQVFEDWGQVPSYLDGRLRYGLKRRIDGQIVAGNGTSPNLEGLGARSNIATYAPAAAGTEEAAVSIRKAITVGQQNEAVYEIVVLNPADAEKFDLVNFATAGVHATPDAASALPTTAWGLTRVVSNAVASGTALLIDPMAVAIFDRQAPTAHLTDSHASNFTSNILTLLLEARIGLGLFDPKGVCKVTFDYTP